jgi:uncharacterized protein (TIGR02996 family)
MDDDRPFLRAILADPDDAALRLVYADWLEERGDERAEFLRLEARLVELPATAPSYLKLNDRFHELHERLDANWLALLDCTPIDKCQIRFRFQCPKRWEKLTPTESDAVRFCKSCKKNVYHCGSLDEARDHAWQGDCVAIDSRLAREPGDLEDERNTEGQLMGFINFAPDSLPPPLNLPLPPEPPPKRWWQFWK